MQAGAAAAAGVSDVFELAGRSKNRIERVARWQPVPASLLLGRTAHPCNEWIGKRACWLGPGQASHIARIILLLVMMKVWSLWSCWWTRVNPFFSTSRPLP